MRKSTLLCIIVILAVFTFPLVCMADTTPKVILDGKALVFDTPPVVDNGHTFVPLRTIFESLGAQIDWNDATKTVTATKDSIKIVLTIGETTASVNSKTINLEAPAKIIAGRTLVPLRFVSEAMGSQVDWDGATQTITITSSSASPLTTPQPNTVPTQTITPAKITPDQAITIFKEKLESIGFKMGVDEQHYGIEVSHDTKRFEDATVDGVLYYAIALDENFPNGSGGFSVFLVNSVDGKIYDTVSMTPPQLGKDISDINVFKAYFGR